MLDPIFALRTPRAARARAVGVGRVHHAGGHHAGSAPSSWPTATTIPTPRSGRSIWRGPSTQIELRELGHQSRRRGGLPGARRPPVLLQPRDARAAGRAAAEPGLAAARSGRMGISGDWPIVLATIESADGPADAAAAVRRASLLAPARDDGRPGHPQRASAQLPPGADTSRSPRPCSASSDSGLLDRPGGVFVRRRDLLTADDLLMLRATARVHRRATAGRWVASSRTAEAAEPNELDETEPVAPPPRTFGAQHPAVRVGGAAVPGSRLERHRPLDAGSASPDHGRMARSETQGTADWRQSRSCFDNGSGGLTPEGDYQIRVSGDRLPPAPWANVIANPRGGFSSASAAPASPGRRTATSTGSRRGTTIR